MRHHIPTLAEAFRFYGAFVAVVTAVSTLMLLGMAAFVGIMEGVAAAALVATIAMLVVPVGLGVATMYRRVGDGLHAHRPWARYAALVLSVMVLGDLPFGLPLGLLGLGVLLDGQAAAAFGPQAKTEAVPSTAQTLRFRPEMRPRQSA